MIGILRITYVTALTMMGAWWARLLGLRKKAPDYYWAGKSWVETPTYRVNERFKQDRLSALKTLKQSLTWIWTRKLPVPGTNYHTACFSGLPQDKELRLRYLKMAGVDGDIAYFSRNDLLSGGTFLTNLWLTATLLVLAAGPVVMCFFSKRRGSYGLMPIEIMESLNFLRFVRKSNMKHLHYFYAYEKDANLHTLLLRRFGVRINKITSEIPMALINRIMLSDELSLCMSYQQEELPYLKESVRVSEVRLWFPEAILNYAGRYRFPNVYGSIPQGTVGYYSSGSWARKMEGHSDYGDGFFDAEPQLIKALATYMKARPELELKIFVHPYEKVDKERYEMALEYYAKAFEGARHKVMPMETSTSEAFNHVDVAVSVYSTVSFERLFMGFKSAVFPVGIDFPFPGTNMARISPKNEHELWSVLDRGLKQSREAFLAECGYASSTITEHPRLLAEVSSELQQQQQQQS